MDDLSVGVSLYSNMLIHVLREHFGVKFLEEKKH